LIQANGLTLHRIRTPKGQLLHTIADISLTAKSHIPSDSFVIAYLDYKVLIGRCSNGSFAFCQNALLDPKYVQRIRIFNKNEELLLWRTGSGVKGRYRVDGNGDETDVVDAEQVLFGTNSRDLGNGFTRLFEKRGTELVLPFSELEVTETSRVTLKTRNYVDFNKAHQASYWDCRCIGFSHNGKELR